MHLHHSEAKTLEDGLVSKKGSKEAISFQEKPQGLTEILLKRYRQGLNWDLTCGGAVFFWGGGGGCVLYMRPNPKVTAPVSDALFDATNRDSKHRKYVK